MPIVTDGLIRYYHSSVNSGGTILNIAPVDRGVENLTTGDVHVYPNGLEFTNGHGDFEIPAEMTSINSPFTFEFYMDLKNPDTYPDIIFSQGVSYLMYASGTPSNVELTISASNNESLVLSNLNIQGGKYFALVYTPNTNGTSKLEVYMDSVKVGEKNYSTRVSILRSERMRIGSGQNFNPVGTFNSIRLYNRALSFAEIKQNFNERLNVSVEYKNTTDPITENLLGFWHYEKGISGNVWGNIAPETKGQYNAELIGNPVIDNGAVLFEQIGDLKGVEFPNLNITNQSFTVEILFKLYPINSFDQVPLLVSNPYSDTMRLQLSHNAGGSGESFIEGNTGKGYFKNSEELYLNKTQDIHVVYKYDHRNENEWLHVNGLGEWLDKTNADSAPTWDKAFNVGFTDGLSKMFEGWVSYVRVYGTDLADDEILNNFFAGKNTGLPDDFDTSILTYEDVLQEFDTMQGWYKTQETQADTKQVLVDETPTRFDTRQLTYTDYEAARYDTKQVFIEGEVFDVSVLTYQDEELTFDAKQDWYTGATSVFDTSQAQYTYVVATVDTKQIFADTNILVVTDIKGVSEPVLDYKGLEITEEVNGDFSLSCLFLDTEKNKHAWSLIEEESILEYDGHEYRIKQKSGETLRKQVHAPHVYFDLIDHQVYGTTGGTMYPADAFTFALSGTGWTFQLMDDLPPQLLFNFGEDNALALIKKAREAFDCEVKIEPGRHLKIHKRIGKDDDYQFRYRHNIKAIKETVDTTKLATVIRGYGGNGLFVTYTSPNYDVFGEKHAEPIRDENILEASVMTEMLKRKLVDAPEVSIELDAIMFGSANLGDTVWLIHEKLGIEFQTRIMARTHRPRTLGADTVTLGTRKHTLSDLLTEAKVEIDENAKQFRSSIEQTNDRISLEVESVNESIATLVINADNIQLGVTELNGRLGNAESRIDIQAGQIESRVSYSDYNGQTIASKITQSPYAISLMAQELNFEGLVTFSNLNTPGSATIDGGNIYGSSFVVGRGTGSTLTMTSRVGSHLIESIDAAGLGIKSNGSMGLHASGHYGVYVPYSPLVAQQGFRVEGGLSEFNTNVTVNANLNASSLSIGGLPVATQSWVSNLIGGGSGDSVVWSDTYRIQRGGASLKFLYGSATIQARNYYDSSFGTFEGLAYSNVSKRELKKHIEPFDKKASDLVADTPVYSYRYNNDLDTEPKRVGLIYDEAPMEIMQFTGGIDVYGMASILWKAVQELREEVNQLKQIK